MKYRQAALANTTSIFNMKGYAAFGLMALLMLCSSFLTHADEHKDATHNMASALQIEEPWARATFALAKTGAAYFTAINTGETPITITSVSVTENVAMMAELHHTVMQDDMMKMQELKDGVKVNVGERLEFSPGGKHIMLMGLKGPLNKDESVTITLHFEDDSQQTVVFAILDKRNASH